MRVASRAVLVALAGGVGAARLLRGAMEVREPSSIVAVVNTGDDVELHGLHVSPDLDTVLYTLADAVDRDRGWGLLDDTWAVMHALERYPSATWFRLGDRDLATHLYRTGRLAEGVPLSRVTAELAHAWGVAVRLLPMSDDPVTTRVTVEDGEIGFQEYFVQRRHAVPATAVRFAGAEAAAAGPGVLEAIGDARAVVICPSNPIVSIGPILAVPGVRAALARRRETVVAVSPIVAGAALKGPAARLMAELGHEPSVVGVARLYAPVAGTVVVDRVDAALAGAVEAAGVRCVVTPAIMHGPAEAAALTEAALGAVGA